MSGSPRTDAPPATAETAPGDPHEDATLRALGLEVLRINRRGLVNPTGTRLDGSAYKILMALRHHGPLSVGGLGEHLHLDASTTSRQVKAAVGAGLVERTLGEDGAHLVRPTPAGTTAYEKDSAVRAVHWRAVVRELGPERARRLAEDLAALNEAIDATQA
ncbi:MarR family winged helix-turn-helix transcriptional regulator [Nocardioides bruguierae]|uniref:MarR family winged helix-turn-helix transcriptional regulator n=1 Tax=Nocardioides bruguierae TaxID=2945102 RepID=A0A9X2IFC5_9ACTN|nr:MarR family winged helix-turn-helix transcriptional regulator [Nocardioides bruguierae]MCM0621187.1 MarR family winged helix-turn-helix transcriptional regulator [Nocardioides bruguierae]